MKNIRYFFEAIFVYLIFIMFRCLPRKTASNFGGWIGRALGPKLKANKKALKNLLMAMPELDDNRANEIINGMWGNLGRVIAEYPHLEAFSKNDIIIENEKELISQIKAENTPLIFIGGHFSNWEIASMALMTQHNCPIDITYRAPNNPWVAKLLDKSRTLNHRLNAYPKSIDSGRKIMQALKDGHSLGILIDQKYNEGMNIPFFNLPAMTNPIFAQLSQRYRCPLIPIRVVRINDGCTFRLEIHPPLESFNVDGTPRPIEDIIKDAHNLLEEWIKEKPEHWLWLHNRWK